MHRPPARAGCAALAGVALALLLAGCGGGAKAADHGPSKDTLACRGEWKDLGKQVQGNDQKTNPSALAARWNSVVATIDYYATGATDSDCGDTIREQRDAMTALTSFGEKLAPYDMELRLEQVRDDAEAYAAAPRPSPSPSPTPKGSTKKNKKKPKPPPLPPAPATIGAAMKAFATQAPLATEQQGPGWQQARVAELTDTAAVAKTVKDLAFLSTESAAYRACQVYLAKIRLALAAGD